MPSQTSTLAKPFDVLAEKRTREIVSRAFKILITIFPAWRQAVHGDVKEWAAGYKRQLLAAFIEHGIDTLDKLSHGLTVARASDSPFLPNPGTFARGCKKVSAPYHREFPDRTAAQHRQLKQQVSTPGHRRKQLTKLKALCIAASNETK